MRAMTALNLPLDDLYELRPQQLQLGFLKVLKGSYIMRKKKITAQVLKHREPYEVLATNWLSYGEICRLKGIEDMVEVYYNSGQFSPYHGSSGTGV